MTTTTLTLAAFLAARLAEDEAEALAVERDVTAEFGHAMSVLSSALAAAGSGYMEYPVLTIDPTRVLAEVAAKRAVLGEHEGSHNCTRYVDPDDNLDCTTLRHLAAVYADREDYDPSWAVS